MKKNNAIMFSMLFLTLLLSGFVSPLECWSVATQNTEIQLIQKCPSCSFSNLTSISYPNGTVFLNEAMEQNGVNFNFTLPDSSQEGRISYGTIGDKDGASPPLEETLCIEITKTGTILNKGETPMYIIILIFISILLALSLYIAIITPYQNLGEMSSNGPVIVRVTKTKYVKIMAAWFSYGLLLIFITILTGMINNYIQFEPMKEIFTSTYLFLSILGYVVSLVAIVLLIWNTWKDIILNKKILEGGKALLKEL